MKIKIYADSAIARENAAYELIPVIIIKNGVEIEDCNDPALYNEILNSGDIVSYTMDFYSVEKMAAKINKDEPTIIFTCPKSMSKQYEVYKKLEDEFPKLAVVEGSSFYNRTQRIVNAIKEFDDIEEIKEEVIKLNETMIFQALITDFDHLHKQGVISTRFSKFSKTLGGKAWIVFSNGEWKNHKFGRNVTKLTKGILSKIGDQPSIKIYTATLDNPIAKKIEALAIECFPYKKVEIKTFTTALLISSGKDFITIG